VLDIKKKRREGGRREKIPKLKGLLQDSRELPVGPTRGKGLAGYGSLLRRLAGRRKRSKGGKDGGMQGK